MANSATVAETYRIGSLNVFEKEITATTIIIDTTDTDLTVLEGVPGKRIALVGYLMVVPADATVIIKSGSNNRINFPLGSKSGPVKGQSPDEILLVLGDGDDLVIRSSAAINESEIQTIFI